MRLFNSSTSSILLVLESFFPFCEHSLDLVKKRLIENSIKTR